MIEKQREKEFLFELERLYYNYNLIIDSPDSFQLVDLGYYCSCNVSKATRRIERAIDFLRTE